MALDSGGRAVYFAAILWAGEATLAGRVVNEAGQALAGASVTVSLGVDASVRATTATNGTGDFSFPNMPERTVTVEATAPGNRHVVVSSKGTGSVLVLEARAIGMPSPVDNNDFAMGLAGWDVGDALVEIVPHVDDDMRPAGIEPAAEPDFDLKLQTFGEGARRVSRTFTVNPGSRFVKVRYRFVTSEVPGGFFGTEYDDAFSVSLRSQNGQGVIAESASMNSLGLGAFDPEGATRWRETKLRVSEFGDVVTVDVSVANVADDLLDSFVVIDAVSENSFTLSDIELRDIDDSPLKFLSLAPHPYLAGKTRIHGELTVEGEGDDATHTITLQVVQNGEVRAAGRFIGLLPPGGVRAAIGDEFEYSFDGPLFEIDSAQLAMIDKSADSSLLLVVRAMTASGKQSIYPVGPVTLLTRFTGSNRFTDRDTDVGGDDWAQPGLVGMAEYFTFYGDMFGDFSNMNGGKFPPHAGHRSGNGVDAWFPGYEARNAATAAAILARLNDQVYGSRIARVLVTFEKSSADPFWTAIANVTLADGRRAADVIHPAPGYRTRFHWDRVAGDEEEEIEPAAIAQRRERSRTRAQ